MKPNTPQMNILPDIPERTSDAAWNFLAGALKAQVDDAKKQAEEYHRDMERIMRMKDHSVDMHLCLQRISVCHQHLGEVPEDLVAEVRFLLAKIDGRVK